jgi:RNA polymerase sigma factor (sigma-70 family)
MLDGLMVHFRHLEKLLRRRGRTREDAEDLIQETFLRVQMYLDEGGEIREPQAFLVRTALNLSQDARKHEHRHLYARKSVEDYVIPDLGPSPEEVLEAEERVNKLKRALNKAGVRSKEIFIMHRLHGMTYLQIADHFDLSQSAVEKYMAKAIAALSEELLTS